MAYLIAITGKGGTGKTTIAAFLTRLFTEQGIRPVLAVDADPNSTLAPLLGVAQGPTISDIREEMLKAKGNVTGVSKERILKAKLEERIVESNGFDLLTMGRPEGQHCYCFVNSLLRQALSSLKAAYKATIVDNEAGMEHLSRMNTDSIDCLVVVSEPTVVGAKTAARILELTASLPVTIGKRVLVWNKVTASGVPKDAQAAVQPCKFDDRLSLPYDDGVAQFTAAEKSVFTARVPHEFLKLVECCTVSSSMASGKAKGKT